MAWGAPPLAAASLAAVNSLSLAASASISATRARIAAISASSASSSPPAASDEGAAAGAASPVGAVVDEDVGAVDAMSESGSSMERRRPDEEASADMAGAEGEGEGLYIPRLSGELVQALCKSDSSKRRRATGGPSG